MTNAMKAGETAILTTAVGCLDAFEKAFGEHLKLKSDFGVLSDSEKHLIEISNSFRKEVFNIGNRQRRRFIQTTSN